MNGGCTSLRLVACGTTVGRAHRSIEATGCGICGRSGCSAILVGVKIFVGSAIARDSSARVRVGVATKSISATSRSGATVNAARSRLQFVACANSVGGASRLCGATCSSRGCALGVGILRGIPVRIP